VPGSMLTAETDETDRVSIHLRDETARGFRFGVRTMRTNTEKNRTHFVSGLANLGGLEPFFIFIPYDNWMYVYFLNPRIPHNVSPKHLGTALRVLSTVFSLCTRRVRNWSFEKRRHSSPAKRRTWILPPGTSAVDLRGRACRTIDVLLKRVFTVPYGRANTFVPGIVVFDEGS